MSEPKEKFRGWFIPAEVVELFQSGKISARETLLLATIDSLVSKDKGCFASNEYLAKKLRIEPDTISRAVTKLKRLGLVRQVGFDGRRRILETCWSRIRIGSLGEKSQSGQEKSPTSLGEKSQSGQEKSPTSLGEKSQSGQEKSPTRVYKKVNKRVDKIKNGTKQVRPRARNGFFTGEFDYVMARQLKDILTGTDLGDRVRIDTLAKRVSRLRHEKNADERRIHRMVEFLREHGRDEYTPKIYKVNDIVDKFYRIEDAMNRHRKETGDSRDNLVEKVRMIMERNGTYDLASPFAIQKDVDEALTELGLEPGTVLESEI